MGSPARRVPLLGKAQCREARAAKWAKRSTGGSWRKPLLADHKLNAPKSSCRADKVGEAPAVAESTSGLRPDRLTAATPKSRAVRLKTHVVALAD